MYCLGLRSLLRNTLSLFCSKYFSGVVAAITFSLNYSSCVIIDFFYCCEIEIQIKVVLQHSCFSQKFKCDKALKRVNTIIYTMYDDKNRDIGNWR